MRLVRGFFAFFVVAVGLVAVGSPAAHACTCDAPVRSVDETAGDTAFVGTLVEITDGVWQFEVEQWLTQPRGSATGVVSDGSNDCGLQLARGERVAVYAHADPDGVPRVDMCAIGDADAALAALDPLETHPDAGPSRYLIGPGSGPPHYWLVDAAGRVTGFVETPELPSSELRELSVCPGQRRIAERWNDRAIVRDLATLQPVRSEPLPAPTEPLLGYTGIVCRDADGSQVLVGREFLESPITKVIPDLVEIGEPGTPVVTGNFRSLTFLDAKTALVTVNIANTRLEVLDLDAGTSRLLDEARDIEEPVSAPPMIDSYTVSPSGERVAFSIRRAIQGKPNRIDTFVWEISPGRQIAAYRESANTVPNREWFDDDSLLVTSGRGEKRRTEVVDALTGEATGDPTPAADGPYIFTEEAVVAVDSSRLVALDDDRAVPVAQFGNEFLEGPIRLKRPVPVTADLPVAATPPTTPLTTTTQGDPGSGSDSGEQAAAAVGLDDDPPGGPTLGWAIGGIVAGLIIVGITILISRDSDEPTFGPGRA